MPKDPKDVVSALKRSAAGSGAKDVADEDIDNYVAQLLLKEAQEKKQRYKEIGMQAYLPSTPKPKPNTRFLLNVVRATDSHNQGVLRRQGIRGQERKERERRREGSRSPERELSYRGRGKVRMTGSMDKRFQKTETQTDEDGE